MRDAQLVSLSTLLPHGVDVRRFLIFDHSDAVTPPSLVSRARAALAEAFPQAQFVGGTNLYFAQLNAARPDATAMDAVVFPLTPQVHAFDDLSLIETLDAQGDMVATARSFSEGKPIVVSPITLRPRFNPDAQQPTVAQRLDGLPSNVDPRQMSLLAAGWMLGSVKAYDGQWR